MCQREGRLVPGKPRYGFINGTEGPLPQHADAVIIGAGILGIMTAIDLTEKGLSVVIVEKGNIAGEQSSRFYGQLMTYKMEGETFMLHHLGKEHWRGMNKKVGMDTSYRTQGRVEVPLSDQDLQNVRSWIDQKKELVSSSVPLNTRIIQGEELKNRLKGATSNWTIAGFEEDSGSLDPEIAAFRMAEYAKKIGVKIYTQCAARGIEKQGGAVSDVVTENGVIRTPRAVVCGGAWSRLFMQNLDIDLQTLPAYQSQQLITGGPGLPGANVALPGNIFFREQANGTYATSPRIEVIPIVKDSFIYGYKYLPLLAPEDVFIHFSINEQLLNSFKQTTKWSLDKQSPFETNRDMVAVADVKDLNASLVALKEEFPAFTHSKIIDQWSGAMAVAPDESPIISVVNECPGLVVNTATSWGMTESPVSASIAADLLLGNTPVLNAKAFSLYRFS
ncbi:FAD-dependent oxidoreductase [bacteria symbiont BFo2 of Frankliniella occidentalis]|nr:FAD-dependent oxidoreductase [bacteria symbiont BFo2 of Frankliniella occidentalis]